MALSLDSTAPLPGGVRIPLLGFGVFQVPPGATARRAVADALEVGYRHIDTAMIYRNEADVGQAVKESGLKRDEVFITTKVWNDDQGYESTLKACATSLGKLGTPYIDLYLIHWPVGPSRKETWRALEKLKAEGKVRAIGVSNFTEGHLDDLKKSSSTVPSVNQVEFSPFLNQKALHADAKRRGILIEAYSPLAKAKKLDDARLKAVAARVKRTPAQVMLRWGLQHEMVILPRSAKRAHIAENAALYDFELSAAEMAELDRMDEGFRTSWDPTSMP